MFSDPQVKLGAEQLRKRGDRADYAQLNEDHYATMSAPLRVHVLVLAPYTVQQVVAYLTFDHQ